MSALALPLPFRPPLPPLPGGLAGKVGHWAQVEQVANYLRSLRLLPNNVTTPPNPMPPPLGAFGSAAFWLIYFELFASASLGEEFPEGWDRFPQPESAPIGTNPVPELAPGPPQPQSGKYTYHNLKSFRTKLILQKYKLGSTAAADLESTAEQSKSYSGLQEYDDPVSVEVEFQTSVRNVHPEGYGKNTLETVNTTNYVVTSDLTGEVLKTYSVTEAQGGDVEVGKAGPFSTEVGTFQEFTTITDMEYYTVPGDSVTPGPLVPQPSIYTDPVPIPQPQPQIKPVPMTALATVPVLGTVKQFAPTLLYKVKPTTLPTPPLPSEFPAVAPKTVPLIAPPAVKPVTVPGNAWPLLPGQPPNPPANNIRPTTPRNVHFPLKGKNGIYPSGARPDLRAVAKELGRVENKSADMMNKIAVALGYLDLLMTLLLKPRTEPITYTLEGVCEDVDESGQQPKYLKQIPEDLAEYGIAMRLDALAEMLQVHLGYKTPTCESNTKPVLEGEWRTVSFRSDSVSPYGKSRLRKRFRYRSVSGIGLPGVVDHWKDFVWEAGPVCVQHAGASWGTPQVWAAWGDEGKRVIRHAAREAGIDPDQDGRWIISGSDSARVGVSGTMRVDTKGGYYWITARDGSDGRPIVALT